VAATVAPMLALTTGGGVRFVVGICIWVISYVALGKVITKAGFSGWWILIALCPPVILFGGLVAISSTVQYGNVSNLITELKTWGDLFVFSLFVNWVAFLIFAFRAWPALDSAAIGTRPAPRGPEPRAAVAGAPAVPSSFRATPGTAPVAPPPVEDAASAASPRRPAWSQPRRARSTAHGVERAARPTRTPSITVDRRTARRPSASTAASHSGKVQRSVPRVERPLRSRLVADPAGAG
jgi:hypothetical protein